MSRKRLSLKDVEWGEFELKHFFTIMRGNATNISKKNVDLDDGIALISAKDNNNAINGFTKNEPKDKIFKNVLSINNNGSIGFTFYHKYSFIATSDVTILNPKVNMTQDMMIFISRIIQNNAVKKFAYGYKASNTRIRNSKILLPLDNFGNPNWQFMEDYIKQEQKEIAQKVISYYEQKILETGFDLVGLEDVEWRSFKIKDIFSVKSVKGKTISKYEQGKIPYISTSSQNNGLTGFINSVDEVSIGKCISIDPIAGNCFYHDYDFVGRGGAGSAINLLYNEKLDYHNGQFIISSLEKVSKNKASYGLALNGNRLKSTKIILPTDKNGDPHWEYMSKFMKKIEDEKLEKVLEYIYIYKLAISRESKLLSLYEKEWKEFWLEDIVDIKSGVRLTKANQNDGKIAFIGSIDNNNGITNFVSNMNKSLDKNVLGVNYNGSVVENFYHPYECIFSDDVKRIKWKNASIANKYTYLFLKQLILQQKEKYAYCYKFNGTRMKRQKIFLPIDSNENPDYDYMKKYMQIQEIKKYYDLIKFYKNKP